MSEIVLARPKVMIHAEYAMATGEVGQCRKCRKAIRQKAVYHGPVQGKAHRMLYHADCAPAPPRVGR